MAWQGIQSGTCAVPGSPGNSSACWAPAVGRGGGSQRGSRARRGRCGAPAGAHHGTEGGFVDCRPPLYPGRTSPVITAVCSWPGSIKPWRAGGAGQQWAAGGVHAEVWTMAQTAAPPTPPHPTPPHHALPCNRTPHCWPAHRTYPARRRWRCARALRSPAHQCAGRSAQWVGRHRAWPTAQRAGGEGWGGPKNGRWEAVELPMGDLMGACGSLSAAAAAARLSTCLKPSPEPSAPVPSCCWGGGRTTGGCRWARWGWS